MHDTLTHLPSLLHGLLVTVEMTVLAFVLAVVLGTVMAIFRVSPVAPLRWVGTAFVEFFRNVPLLVLLVLFVFGLPDAGVRYNLFLTATTCVGLSGAAFTCESVRSGIFTVSVGQAEAARAIGLTFGQSLRHVVLPQAFRAMVQPLVNVFIGVALSTSLAAAVGVTELTGQTQLLDLKYAEPIPTFLAAAVLYVAITFTATVVGGRIERRAAIKR